MHLNAPDYSLKQAFYHQEQLHLFDLQSNEFQDKSNGLVTLIGND